MTPIGKLLSAPALVLALLLGGCAQTDGGSAVTEPFTQARVLFEKFVSLGNDYDQSLADLYAEEAKILLLQQTDGGGLRRVSVAGTDFKELVPRILPKAAKAGEKNTFSDVTFSERGSRVRIDALRTSTPQGFQVPHILVVGPSPQGDWLIYEEVTLTLL